MKRAALCLILFVGLAGCSREDWKTVEVALPEGVTHAQAVEVLTKLDRLTPPQIERQGDRLIIHYNSMRVSPGNFSYELNTLSEQVKESR